MRSKIQQNGTIPSLPNLLAAIPQSECAKNKRRGKIQTLSARSFLSDPATSQKNLAKCRDIHLCQNLSPQYLFPPNIEAPKYLHRKNPSADKTKYHTPLPRPQDRPPDNYLHASRKNDQEDHLSPQYLHPPNPSALLDTDSSERDQPPVEKTFLNTTNFRVHVHGDHLSPQYLYPPNSSETRSFPLHPPNPKIKLRISSKESRKLEISSENPSKFIRHRELLLQQNPSPQYLYQPGDPKTKTGDHLSIQHLQLEPSNEYYFERVLKMGDQNLSPQYLSPPNFQSPLHYSESSAETHWGVAALSARRNKKNDRNKPLEYKLPFCSSMLLPAAPLNFF